MNETKKEVLNKYHQLKEQLGHKPSYREFLRLSGISNARVTLDKVFGNKSYSKLVNEAGDEPNIFFRPGRNIEDLLVIWGNIVRKLGRVPGEADWSYYKFEPQTNRFREKLGGLLKIPERFGEFAKDKPEWNDVLALLPKVAEANESKENVFNEKLASDHDINQFLPPIISNLCELGSIEGKSIEFEQGVYWAFRLLGFEVRDLGQGSGRNPDGIALYKKDHYAIIYDAKSRKDGYSIGTDDRTIIEYIKTHKNNLSNEGCGKIYFLIISNKFNKESKIAFNRIFKETGAPVILIKTEDLLSLVAHKYKYQNIFDLATLQDLLLESGQLDKGKVESFLEQLK